MDVATATGSSALPYAAGGGKKNIDTICFYCYPRFHFKLYAKKKCCVRYSGPPYYFQIKLGSTLRETFLV